MDDKLFSVYLTPADYGKLSYAKLELPASPWALLDALDKVRFTEEESLYLEITDYHDFEELHSCLTCSSMSLLELNDLAKRMSWCPTITAPSLWSCIRNSTSSTRHAPTVCPRRPEANMRRSSSPTTTPGATIPQGNCSGNQPIQRGIRVHLYGTHAGNHW